MQLRSRGSAGPVQAVGVGDDSEPGRSIGRLPSESALVDLVIDRDAQACELSEVVLGTSGCGAAEHTTLESSTSLWQMTVPPTGSASVSGQA
jgi:hypothetical protein